MRLLSAIVLVILVAMPVHASPERVLRVPYDTAAPGPISSAQVVNPTPYEDGRAFELGGRADNVLPGETTVEAFMLDASQRKTPGRVAFYDESGGQITFVDFCFETELALPPGTVSVGVFASTLPPLASPCPLAGLNYGPAVRGEMVLTFR